jgi:hypothetical protein
VKTDISLRAGDSERFDEIKAEIEDQRGTEPSNSEVLRILMDDYQNCEFGGVRRSASDRRNT